MNIKLLETSESTLSVNSFWQHYQVLGKKNVIIDGFKFFDVNENEVSSEKRIEEIQHHIDINEIYKLSELSKPLAELAMNCHQSDNEMFFIEHDDEWLENVDLSKLSEEIAMLEWENYVEINDDKSWGDCLITVYGGISELINFVD